MRDNETFKEHKKRKSTANRGKRSETKAQKALVTLRIEYDRHHDTRAAGRPLPAAVADFTIYTKNFVAMLEIKEIAKGTRLKKFVQRPRMQKRCRNSCCKGFVMAHFLEAEFWVLIDIQSLDDSPSWDFGATDTTKYKTAKEALETLL